MSTSYENTHHQSTGAQNPENDQQPVSSAGITLARLLLTLFNLVLILFGTILVVVGISAHNHLNAYIELVGDDNINKAALTLVISGSVCVLTAVASYLGANKQSVCVLYFTGSILFLVFIAVTVAATGAVVYHGKINTIFRQGMTKTISQAYWNENSDYEANDFMKTIGYLQENLKCCGIDNYNDWSGLNPHFNTSGISLLDATVKVPVSCCKTEFCGLVIDGQVILKETELKDEEVKTTDTLVTMEHSPLKSFDTRKIHTQGCYQEITDFVSTNTIAVLICSYGLAVFQLVGIIFSCCLCRAISGAGAYRAI